MEFTRVVARGVDTLVLFTTAPCRVELVEQLEALKARARHERHPAPVDLGGVDLEVQSHGVGGGRFLASSDFFAVKVNPDTADDTTPTVTVEVRALALWSLGWRRAGDKAVELLRTCTLEAVPVMPQVSRVDLCVDWQGWVPTPGDRTFLHSRARKRTRHWVDDPQGWQWLDNDAGRAWLKKECSRVVSLAKQLAGAKAESQQRALLRELLHLEDVAHAEHDDGRHFTGFSIGAGGALSARCYDKRRETETRRKTWFEGVWSRAGAAYNPEATVWRLEYQLRREGLRSMRLEHAEGDFAPGSWEALKQNVASLWKYLAREWLYHGSRTAELRGALSPHWKVLAELEGWGDECDVLDLHRQAAEGQGTRLVAGLAGYLSSVAAVLVEQGNDDHVPDFGELINQVLGAAYTHAHRAEKERDDDPASGMEVRYRRKVLRLRARRTDPHKKRPEALRREWLERAKEGIGPNQWVRYGFHPAGAQNAAQGGQLLRFDGNDERAWKRALQEDRLKKALDRQR